VHGQCGIDRSSEGGSLFCSRITNISSRLHRHFYLNNSSCTSRTCQSAILPQYTWHVALKERKKIECISKLTLFVGIYLFVMFVTSPQVDLYWCALAGHSSWRYLIQKLLSCDGMSRLSRAENFSCSKHIFWRCVSHSVPTAVSKVESLCREVVSDKIVVTSKNGLIALRSVCVSRTSVHILVSPGSLLSFTDINEYTYFSVI